MQQDRDLGIDQSLLEGSLSQSASLFIYVDLKLRIQQDRDLGIIEKSQSLPEGSVRRTASLRRIVDEIPKTSISFSYFDLKLRMKLN